MSQLVQQGTLACIGIAHQAHLLHFTLVPGPLLLFPASLHLPDLFFQEGDPVPDPAPVHFQFGFTGPPGTDTAAQPGKTGPLSHDPGQHVLQLGQFHLELAFAGPGPFGEDVQDQAGTVDDPHPQGPFQVPLLGRGQFVIEDAQIDVFLLGKQGHFLDLALADEEHRIRLGPALDKFPDYQGSGSLGQLGQLFH